MPSLKNPVKYGSRLLSWHAGEEDLDITLLFAALAAQDIVGSLAP
jgi:hypothetical protein